MPVVPFSQTGVDQKLTELYSLSDPLLQEQADSIKSDFRSWLTDAFDFSPEQLSYLNGMDLAWLDQAGANAAQGIIYRLPVILYPPEPEPPHSSKYVRTTNNVVISYNTGTGTTATGSITFRIEYV